MGSRNTHNGRCRSGAPALLAVLILMTGFAGPSAAAPASAGAQPTAGRTVSVILRVHGCNGCRVRAIRAYERGGEFRTWDSGDRIVRDGRVRLRIPQGHTRGVYVSMTSTARRAAHLLNAMPLVAFRYAGLERGQRVSAERAARARRGFPCWGGTDRRRVAFDVQVDRWWGRNRDTGKRGFEIRPYLRRGALTRGGLAPAHKGTVGTQDADPCHLTY